jgi:type II secretory pathway component PulM
MLKTWLDIAIARARELAAPYLARLRTRIDPLYAQWRERYLKLERRERTLVQVAAVLIAVLFAYNLVYRPIAGIPGLVRDRVEKRERDLAQIKRMAAAYGQLKGDLAEAQRAAVPAGKDFSLFSEIETTLTKSLGKDKITAIAPAANRPLGAGLTQYSVDLALANLSLSQVVDTLYQIRTLSVPVSVANLHIKRRPQDTRAYDVDMTCVALGKNG